MQIKTMTKSEAEEIIKWQYDAPYDFYNFPNPEQYELEILNENYRNQYFYSVYENDQLIGLYEIHVEDNIATLGLGMKPDKTGQGKGQQFVENAIHFIKTHHPEVMVIDIAVVSFNERAMKVYERCGFTHYDDVLMMSYGTLHEFVKMKKEI